MCMETAKSACAMPTKMANEHRVRLSCPSAQEGLLIEGKGQSFDDVFWWMESRLMVSP